MERTPGYQPPEQMPADAGNGLTTERLTLRRYTLEDLPTLVKLNADPDVMRFLGGPMSEAQTREMLEERMLGYYDVHPGLGAWATIDIESGACVGMHLLNHVQGETAIQVGYRLMPQYWGRGYATEMSMALLHYGFVQLGLPLLVANTDTENFASHHVLLKSGLQRSGEKTYSHPAYAGFGPLAYFERGAKAWLAEFQPKLAGS